MRQLLVIVALLLGSLVSGCKSAPPTPEERGRQAVSLYKDGVQQFNEGKVNEGITSLKKGNELQPDYTLLRFDLARMLIVRGERADLSAMGFEEKARLDRQEGRPDDARQKEEEAKRLHRDALQDFVDARDHLVWVAAKWPQEPGVPYFLSVVSTGLGDYRGARKYLEQALKIGNPTDIEREKLQRALQMLEQAETHDERLREKRGS